MPRPFFGSGFFPLASPLPEAYAALVAAFGGDDAAADAWLDDWIAYAGDGATMRELLDALESAGVPADAIAVLRTAPVSLTPSFGPEISPPLYDHPVEVVGANGPGAPSLATF